MWNITLVAENTATPVNVQAISSDSPSDQTFHAAINSTNFTYSRISPPNSSPLVSRLLFSPVNDYINGTEVSCVDSLTSERSSVAVINISNGNQIQGIL